MGVEAEGDVAEPLVLEVEVEKPLLTTAVRLTRLRRAEARREASDFSFATLK